MGCDIHLFCEVKKGDAWELRLRNYRDGDMMDEFDGRWYKFFALLADVRNGFNIKPIKKPVGLPPDISKELKDYLDCCEVHSKSYLTLKELKAYKWPKVKDSESEEDLEGLKLRFNKLIATLETIEPEPDKIRIVFGFDN